MRRSPACSGEMRGASIHSRPERIPSASSMMPPTARVEAEELFSLGHLSLRHRALGEDLFWTVCRAVEQTQGAEAVASELQELLADQYYCNFSLFQSLPDSWAIGQRFPIAPIPRLDERPDGEAVLADITCDSDGRIDRFIAGGTSDKTLPVHTLRPGPEGPEPYYLGVFLGGGLPGNPG